jgi:hypothetical protein
MESVAEILEAGKETLDDTNAVCAYCQVAGVFAGEEYCVQCANEICEYLYTNNLD